MGEWPVTTPAKSQIPPFSTHQWELNEKERVHTNEIHFYKCLGTLHVCGELNFGYRDSFVKKTSCLKNYIEAQVTVPPHSTAKEISIFSIFPKTNIFTFSDFIFFEKSVFKFFRFHFFENPKINIFKFSDFIFFENPYLYFQISIFSKIRI